jgi:hypothetical protein
MVVCAAGIIIKRTPGVERERGSDPALDCMPDP